MPLFLSLFIVSVAHAELPKGVLYDQWFTVVVDKTKTVAIYNEKVEVTGAEVKTSVRISKKTDTGTVSENIDAVAQNNPRLSPIRFSSTSGGGAVSGEFTKTVLKLKANGTTKQIGVSDVAFLSAMLPAWLGLHWNELKPGQVRAVDAIVENNSELEYRGVTGQIKLLDADRYAQTTGTKRVSVLLGGVASTWWLKPNGTPVYVLWPEQKVAIQSVSKEKAEQALH